MEARDLRIGNYIYTKSGVLRDVKPNDITNFAHSVTMDGPLFLPIPLTEEWLLKFGFEYIGICDDFPKGYYKHKALPEICFDNAFEPAVTSNDWGATYIMVPEMKYVHQLQNLFYALTGEDPTSPEQAPQSPHE